MKSTTVILSALAAVANAAKFTNSEINPVPGESFTLTWDSASGPVTILLKDGPPDDLQTVDTLIAGASGGSFTFTLDPADYPAGTYAFEIIDDSGSNYSLQFNFAGTATPDEDEDSSTTATPSATATDAEESETPSPTASAADEEETSSSTTATRPSRTTTSDDSETSVPGAAGRVSSPLALILVTIAAMVYFN